MIYKSGPTDFPSISHLVAALQHHGSSSTALSRMDVAHEKPRRAGEVGNDASFQPLHAPPMELRGYFHIFMEYSWNIDGICVEYITDIEKLRELISVSIIETDWGHGPNPLMRYTPLVFFLVEFVAKYGCVRGFLFPELGFATLVQCFRCHWIHVSP